MPLLTKEPISLSIGSDSPVSIDSSTLLEPDITSPSTGTLIPGLMMKVSPIDTSSTKTSFSSLLIRSRAVFGDKSIKALIELVVFPFE